MNKTAALSGTLLAVAHFMSPAAAQRGPGPFAGLDGLSFEQRAAEVTRRVEARGLAEPFKGITTDGNPVPGLYAIESTGVSTAQIRDAADTFLDSLSGEQRARTQFAVDDDEWRKWMNPHIYVRQGVSFAELDDAQTRAAVGMLRASLSAKGLNLAQDIMRLNTTLAELNDNNFLEYGEDKYHLTVMGLPSATQPWGWQLEGHHLAINYFVLGDQVVMAPAFWGSEPAVATSGRYAGTSILQDEQAMGLAMLRSLSAEQRQRAVLSENKTSNNVVAQAFADNVVVPITGLPAASMTDSQRRQLMSLIRLWIYNLRDDHADVQIEQIEQHLDATYFAWIGGSDDDSVFYYRVQSPVILIEFDHNTPVGLSHLYPRGVPYKEHIHAVVRLPNGNDYGKDLLRQHLLAVSH
jgi:hypothetical protein